MSELQQQYLRVMEMKRRGFLKWMVAVPTVSSVWLVRHLESAGVRRVRRALKGRAYPGRIKDFSSTELQKPGKWEG